MGPNGFEIPMGNFGELLHNYRQLRGLSVEQLAEAGAIPASSLRAIESGRQPAPPSDIVKRLADELQLGKVERETFQLSAKFSSPMLTAILRPNAPKRTLPTFEAAILVFMIADVRGYTHFTQDHGDAAAAQLTTKFADITRAVAEPWDGHVLELRGDEALVVFCSVGQALNAALALQARFQAETVDHPDLPLAVGIGIDVGEAAVVEDGYRGLALNRAARLCSQAGAGDILVTEGLLYVAPKIESITFQTRGSVQLKGIDGPTTILAVTSAQPDAPP
jgi:class 3 adenylate cyclase